MPRMTKTGTGSTRTRIKQKVETRTPHGPKAWNALMRQVIAQVEKNGDLKRAQGFKRALTEGRAEKVLRQYGIIGERDILREFPARKS